LTHYKTVLLWCISYTIYRGLLISL